MPAYDYQCSKCEGIRTTYYKLTSFQRVRVFKCQECSTRCKHTLAIGVSSNSYKHDAPGLYGKFWPSFGCVVENASHLKTLQKKFGTISAADKVGGMDPHEIELHEMHKQRTGEGARSGGGWASNMESLENLSPEESLELARSGR